MKQKQLNNLESNNLVVLALSLLWNIAVFVLFIFIVKPVFDSNDDVTLSLLAENAYGKSDGILLFSNILYTKFLQFLYGITRAVKWYTVIQIGAIFASLYSISVILYKKLGYLYGTLANTLVVSYLGYSLYHTFQFTRTSGICAVAGVLLVFFSLKDVSRKPLKAVGILAGELLIFMSAMIRFDSLGTSAIVMSGLGMIIVFELLKNKDWKRIVQYVVVFAAVFSIPLAAQVYNQHFYSSDEMSYYVEYNSVRANLFDLGFPDYKENKELYNSMGITKKNLQYYETWNMDTSVLTIENMQKLIDAKEKTVTDAHSFKNLIVKIIKNTYQSEYFRFFLFAAIIAVILNKRNFGIAAVQLALVMLIQVYLAYIGRIGIMRVDFCIFIPALITQLYCLRTKPIENNKKALQKGLAFSLAVLSLFPSFVYDTYKDDESKEINKQRAYFELLSQDDENLYVAAISDNAYVLSSSYSLFDVAEENSASNLYYLGGWNLMLPVTQQTLKNYNIDNIYTDSINNPNVLFATGGKTKKILSYIRRNYNKKAEMDLVKVVENQTIYRLRDEKINLDDVEIAPKDSSIVSDIKVKRKGQELVVSGHAYKKNSNSFKQRAFVKIDRGDGTVKYQELVTMNFKKHKDVMNGKYGEIHGYVFTKKPARNYSAEVILLVDDTYYRVYKD